MISRISSLVALQWPYFPLSFSFPFSCLMVSTFYVLKMECFILSIDFFKLSFYVYQNDACVQLKEADSYKKGL